MAGQKWVSSDDGGTCPAQLGVLERSGVTFSCPYWITFRYLDWLGWEAVWASVRASRAALMCRGGALPASCLVA